MWLCRQHPPEQRRVWLIPRVTRVLSSKLFYFLGSWVPSIFLLFRGLLKSLGDDEALDAFNSYIRGPLRSAVMECAGDQLYVPYNMCLVASLPMIFYSATDILQCDATCMSNMGYSSFGNYVLPILLSWISTFVLIVPIFYPAPGAAIT